MKTTTIANKPLYLGSDILKSDLILSYIHQKRCAIISDSHTGPLIAKPFSDWLCSFGIESHLFTVPAGEISKSRQTKEMIEDQMLECGLNRDCCVIAVGGGMITDLSGFIASTYCRGVSLILVPTSLLAMVDASIGGKNGVNTPYGKNLIGTFYHPELIVMDVDLLQTLSKEEFQNGLSELVKHAIIADAEFFSYLEENIHRVSDPNLLIEMIFRSCIIKKGIIEKDTHEKGLRHILNFGHTIAHALEQTSSYTLPHGKAVAMGMIVEGKLSTSYATLSNTQYERIFQLICKIHPHLEIPNLSDANFLKAMTIDKKAQLNVPRFVLLNEIGIPCARNSAYCLEISNWEETLKLL